MSVCSTCTVVWVRIISGGIQKCHTTNRLNAGFDRDFDDGGSEILIRIFSNNLI